MENGEKKKAFKKYKTCSLCGLREELTKENKDTFVKIGVQRTVLGKITGEYKGEGMLKCVFHWKCFDSLDVPTKRRLKEEDFTHRLLDEDEEIWVLLDEEGNPKWDTVFSDIEEIDSEIQAKKKKGFDFSKEYGS